VAITTDYVGDANSLQFFKETRP